MYIKYILEIIIYILYAISIIVALWGVLIAIIDFIKVAVKQKSHLDAVKENTLIKNKLASYILLSLEILVADDIIKSIIKPTFDELAILVILVFIRTILSYFLSKDISLSKNDKNI